MPSGRRTTGSGGTASRGRTPLPSVRRATLPSGRRTALPSVRRATTGVPSPAVSLIGSVSPVTRRGATLSTATGRCGIAGGGDLLARVTGAPIRPASRVLAALRGPAGTTRRTTLIVLRVLTRFVLICHSVQLPFLRAASGYPPFHTVSSPGIPEDGKRADGGHRTTPTRCGVTAIQRKTFGGVLLSHPVPRAVPS
ncbi:MAG: hypothetical protein QG622_1402, partial [Actinomycetota bacterium]|nr:hypothetical protein [Actinomycetota bacterium]